MNCEWTEKISLLVDGELTPEAADATEQHLRACVWCRQAREDFLHLRAQISAYRADLDPRVQRATLAEILAHGASAKSNAKARAVPSRGAGFGERAIALLGLRAHAKAWAAACVLVVAGALFGLILWRDARPGTGIDTAADTQPAPASGATTVAQRDEHGAENRNREKSEEGRETHGAPTAARRRSAPPWSVRARFETVSANGREPRASTPTQTDEVHSEQLTAAVVLPPRRLDEQPTDAEARPGREFQIESPLQTTRHVEQAQLLLRSFRNVRLAGERGASDLAEERRRSQKLLYRNIVLRREAATKGDIPVERVLSSLEPILIDIANLPDRPEGDEVLAIRERMQRKNIVAMLQVSAVADR